MRVLQLIDSLEAGGAERMAVNLANALHDADVPVVLVASRASGVLQSQLHRKVPFYCLYKKSTFDFKAFKLLKSIIKDQNIEVIHAHSSSFFMASVLKRKIPHLQLVWHDHYGRSEMLAKRPKQVLKICAPYFDGIIAVNQKLADWSQAVLKNKRIKVFPNFVVMVNMSEPTTMLKGKVGKRLVCLANLRPQKDHLNLIKAFKVLSDTFPNWTLHLVGKDFEDTYSKRITISINQLKLQDQVFKYDSREDIAHILSQATIGVLSSESEGLPLALLEYGMAGLPVVATAVGDVSQVVKHKESGLLVPAGDTQALAKSLQSLIKEPELAKIYGSQLQKKVLDNYGRETAIQALLEFYKILSHATEL